MSKAVQAPDAADDDGSGKGSTRSRKLLFAIAGAVLLIGGGGGGAYFSGALDGLLGGDPPAEEADAGHGADGGAHAADKGQADHGAAASAEPTFYPLPDVVVSLNTGERRPTYLKLQVSLELAEPGDQPRIERLLPRVMDYCQVYLRELRVDELRGSAGTARLREELLRRISVAVAPIAVKDVLFGQMFVQ